MTERFTGKYCPCVEGDRVQQPVESGRVQVRMVARSRRGEHGRLGGRGASVV